MYFAFLFSLLLCGCQDPTLNHGSQLQPSKHLEQVTGSPLIEVLTGAERVESYRVTPNLEKSEEQIGPYALLRHGPRVKGQVLDKLRSTLTDDRYYVFDAHKKCPFKPEIGFEFIKGQQQLFVFVSLGCQQVQFFFDEEEILLDFASAPEEIRLIAQKLFPFDTKFQNI